MQKSLFQCLNPYIYISGMPPHPVNIRFGNLFNVKIVNVSENDLFCTSPYCYVIVGVIRIIPVSRWLSSHTTTATCARIHIQKAVLKYSLLAEKMGRTNTACGWSKDQLRVVQRLWAVLTVAQ